ncbi:MAG: hypothetical protein IIZ94_08810 [Prevotella sp.]|nr:hypothetical protein [Prevotella sp.]
MITRELARKFRKFIEQMSENATDEDALDNILAFPKWEVGKAYVKDDRIRYENVLYKALQSHTSQADWTPDVAVSLFVKVSIEEYPQWVQPQGAHDAYNKGDKVTHLEKHWESEIDANVYEPSVYGWKEC